MVLSIAVITLAFRFIHAGSLTPPSLPPTATLKTAQQIYDPAVGTSYDSSGFSASANGSAIQIMKCIINTMQGNSCP